MRGNPVAVGRMLRQQQQQQSNQTADEHGVPSSAAELLGRLLSDGGGGEQQPLVPKQPSRPHPSSASSARAMSDNEDDDEVVDPVTGTSTSSSTTSNNSSSFFQSRGSMTGAAPLSKGAITVAGSQFRVPTKHVGCESCLAADVRIKKFKETIRSLKLQLARSEETVADLRRNRGPADTVSYDDSMGSADRLQRLMKKCEESDADVLRLRKLSRADQQLLDAMRESAASTTAELGRCKTARDTLQQENVTQSISIKDLQAQLEAMKMQSLQLKASLEQTEARLQGVLSREKAIGGRSALDGAEIERLSLLLQAAQADNGQLGVENRSLRGDVVCAQEQTSKEVEAREAIEAAGRASRATLEAHNSLLAETILQHESTIGQRDRDNQSLSDSLAGAMERNALQATELERLAALLEQIQLQHLQQQQQQQAALQRAVASSVRLCIVAPSVNVHVADKRMRFKSTLAEQALGDFLRTEVLSKYSFLFKQKDDAGEGGGPPAGGPFPASSASADLKGEGWIDAMLKEMQKSIEAHVAQAVESADK